MDWDGEQEGPVDGIRACPTTFRRLRTRTYLQLPVTPPLYA